MTENRWNNEEILEHLALVGEKIETAARLSGRTAAQISLMAVTKTVPAQFVNTAFGAGVVLFGENRAQELCDKSADYHFGSSNIHFIGALQTNKVRQIIDKVSCIQSVGSLRLAQEISKRAAAAGKTMPVMLEVNIGEEASKAGVPPDQLWQLLEQIAALPALLPCGLMAIPPAGVSRAENRRYFDQMYKLFVDIKHKKIDNVNVEHLSMGMSSDYEDAIASGATLVRIGSGIFGKRFLSR